MPTKGESKKQEAHESDFHSYLILFMEFIKMANVVCLPEIELRPMCKKT